MIDKLLEDPEPDPTLFVPEDEREKLKLFGRGLAAMNQQVNTMTGVRRGIVIRAYEAEVLRLEKERYG